MAAPRLELDPVRTANRVDGTVPGRDRAEPRLLHPQPELEAPVRALAIRPVSGLVRGAARDIADGRVGKAPHEQAQRARLPGRVRIGKADDLARRLLDAAVLCRHLAAPRATDELHPEILRGQALDDLVGPVGRGIGGDDDLEPVGRVVELEQVPHAGLDDVHLVVRGDDDA